VSPLGKKLRAKVRGERQRHAAIVAEVTRILDCGRSSKFEYEASCRAGLRSAFCLDGRSWKFADAYAATIVKEALRRIGAMRPTWAQAQAPDERIERYFCQRCGSEMPPERSARGARYCSKLCSWLAWSARTHRDRVEQHLAEQIASGGSSTRYAPGQIDKVCAHCARIFQTRDTIRKYCSRECASAAPPKYGLTPCAYCGKKFLPKNSGGARLTKYCSRQCFNAARAIQQPCAHCGAPFQPVVKARGERTRFCSVSCANAAKRKPKPNGFAFDVVPQPSKTCETCGGSFIGGEKRRFCSRECKDRVDAPRDSKR
jgi:hypothetical protein